MIIPYTKAHGAGNDFLLTWEESAPANDRPAAARAICERHTGVGADGWYLVRSGTAGCDAAIHLYNSDGSEAELSGNGTRCVAAMLLHSGRAGERLRLLTGAGPRELRLLERHGTAFVFEMAMGTPVVNENEIRTRIPLAAGEREVTVLSVGNPQCAVFVDEFPLDWLSVAAEIEGHPQFPKRTNVSFVKVIDSHNIEARFYERGAGETQSSGTGSMGAAVSAIVRKAARSPVTVQTAAGPLAIRWDDEVYVTGPAAIVAQGEFYW